MSDDTAQAASELLKSYRVDGYPLYIIGTFDTGVTVYSQQVRALNFAWAAVESGLLQANTLRGGRATQEPSKVAIVGGGVAGLTVAAGLIRKGAHASISIFEQRDALLPLQQGSDSRWLHPRIYDWPDEGSEASVAMLRVLNWSAARASDVVVQILTQWKNLLSEPGHKVPLCTAMYDTCRFTRTPRAACKSSGSASDATRRMARRCRRVSQLLLVDLTISMLWY